MLLIGTLCIVAHLGVSLIYPLLLQRGFDTLAAGRFSLRYLGYICSWMIGLLIAQYALSLGKGYFINCSGQSAETRMREQLFRTLLYRDALFYRNTSAGDLLVRVTSDLVAVRQMINQSLTSGVTTVLTIPSTVVLMFASNPNLAIVCLVTIPFTWVTLHLVGSRINKHSALAQQTLSCMTTRASSVFGGIHVAKAFNHLGLDEDRFSSENERYSGHSLAVATLSITTGTVTNLCSGISFGLLLGMGGYLVIKHQITIGVLVLMTSYLGMLSGALSRIGSLSAMIQTGCASLARLRELYSSELDVSDDSFEDDDELRVQATAGSVEFRNVSFRYEGSGEPLLSDITFTIEAGTTVGIVGPTGSGKSTLAALIGRVHDAQGGQILVDGLDVREIPLNDLRSRVAYVSQSPYLFSLTLKENIAFGMTSPSLEHVNRAVQIACLDGDIAVIPGGLDAPVGERGITLSGGQRQRVAIARAVLHTPGIIILDDAVSSVDTRTQKTILYNIHKHCRECTKIYVSQRLSSVQDADMILLMNAGRIIAQGTHASLFATCPAYREMCEREKLTSSAHGREIAGPAAQSVPSETENQRVVLTSPDAKLSAQEKTTTCRPNVDELFGTPYRGSNLISLSPYVRRHLNLLLFAIPLVILTTVLEIVHPMIVKIIIDRHIIAGVSKGLVWWVAVYLGIHLLLCVSRYWSGMLLQSLGQRVVQRLRNELFSHLLRMPIKFFDSHQIGRLLSRLFDDVGSVNQVISQNMIALAVDVVMLVGVVSIMFYSNWQMATICLSITPALLAISFLYRKRARIVSQRIRAASSALNGFVNEHLNGISIVQMFNRQPVAMSQFTRLGNQLLSARMQVPLTDNMLMPAVDLLTAGTILMLILWTGFGITHHTGVTLGVLMMFMQYANRTSDTLRGLSERVAALQDASVATERITNVLSYPAEPKASGTTFQRSTRCLSVEFQNVCFGYNEESPVLRNVSFKVEPGEYVAILGRTGAGKTSLINLLLRFYEPQSGAILIDGIDISTCARAEMRNRIALVQQTPVLFEGTIAENIRYGRTDLSNDYIEEISKTVGAHEFIGRLPGTYAYELTAGGENLSAGQKQLICLTRALCHNPDTVLILDEATASVDITTEAQVQEAVKKVTEKRTCLLITHHLRTVDKSDRIIVLDHGRVVEEGSPEALLKQRGHYYQMVQAEYARDDALVQQGAPR